MSGHTLCKLCNGPITFKRNDRGKWQPVELDGSEHWGVCSARRWQQSGKSNSKPPVSTVFRGSPKLLELAAKHAAEGHLPWEGWSCWDVLAGQEASLHV